MCTMWCKLSLETFSRCELRNKGALGYQCCFPGGLQEGHRQASQEDDMQKIRGCILALITMLVLKRKLTCIFAIGPLCNLLESKEIIPIMVVCSGACLILQGTVPCPREASGRTRVSGMPSEVMATQLLGRHIFPCFETVVYMRRCHACSFPSSHQTLNM